MNFTVAFKNEKFPPSLHSTIDEKLSPFEQNYFYVLENNIKLHLHYK